MGKLIGLAGLNTLDKLMRREDTIGTWSSLLQGRKLGLNLNKDLMCVDVL
jgi:hypothetical protein